MPHGRSLTDGLLDALLDALDELESEAIEILREVAAACARPVMLYSIGKVSSVLLHLARKAFHPRSIPFPLLHVDTGWKFREMLAFRDRVARELGLELLVHTNEAGRAAGINPFDHPDYTDVMKTQTLRDALDRHGFRAAIGGARRDEEASRSKERIYSVRAPGHRWDPRTQRAEFWNLCNPVLMPGQTLRVFPLSNWTEADVWRYVLREGIEVVPLYFARMRPVVERDGTLIVVDDDRMRLRAGEQPVARKVRFRTLGCYPLTGAVESDAQDLPAVVAEVLAARYSERAGRLIDQDGAGAMERKKRDGYF